MAFRNPKIGDLRWQVDLATRQHTNGYDDNGLDVRYLDRRTVRAAIEPLGTAAYLAGQQIDLGRITHRVTVRWQPDLSIYTCILRETILPDGTTREDVYRVHRVAEVAGRTRFAVLDCELEARDRG
ncbi:head-tail adaptor protein [Roseicella sp. DB1501]|uniref:phage head completion protein n=1 Tax=Roseicella sp. DB1501 TaxID=2730925 RepID=UPI0014926BFA|nr:head-tail adaptor protein [Roseicella sp. DB1501]NOG69807.1 head-tail adaptor protein [Roseicella sp. DB1501]